MGMQDFKPSQQKIIKRYYNNIDAISLQRLGELVTDLYLAEGKKKDKLWESVRAALDKCGVAKGRIEHVVGGKNLEQLAGLVKELHAAR